MLGLQRTRSLNARLGGGRQSLDLDSNLRKSFVDQHPDRQDQKSCLERYMKRAITRHFEGQECSGIAQGYKGNLISTQIASNGMGRIQNQAEYR